MMKALTIMVFAAAVPQFCGGAAAQVVDHACTDLEQVPASWITAVKNGLQSHYAHTSHGSQLTWGIQFIEDDNPFYAYEIGYSYLPQVTGEWCVFDGQEGETYITPELYWQTQGGMDMTRAVLDDNPALDTSMWCWCTQCDYYTQEDVQAYLDSMAVLESEYPGVTFVYFTGNAQGTGSSGYNRWLRNDLIRDYCIANNKYLFDFEDLDSWWYNPSSGQWEHHTYEYGGYQIPAEHPQFYGDEYGHTTAESCEQKGRALWWMMALIAGWGGTGVEPDPQEQREPALSVSNPSRGAIDLVISTGQCREATLSVFGLDGRLAEVRPLDGATGPVEARVLDGGSPGIYLVLLECGSHRACDEVILLP